MERNSELTYTLQSYLPHMGTPCFEKYIILI